MYLDSLKYSMSPAWSLFALGTLSGSHSCVYTEIMQGIDCSSPDPSPKSLMCRSGWTLASEFFISVSGNSDTGGQQASISDTVTVTPPHSTLEEGEGRLFSRREFCELGLVSSLLTLGPGVFPWSLTRRSVSQEGLPSPMAATRERGIWDVTQSEPGSSGGSPVWPLSCLLYMYVDTWYVGICMCSYLLSLHLLWNTCYIKDSKGIFKRRKQDCWGEW